MSKRTTDSFGYLRSTENALHFEGIAVPYGQLSSGPVAEYGKPEAFAPAAFRDDLERWANRSDGRRMAFRSAHGEKPIGTITASDTDPGVAFELDLFDTPAGHEYAAQARAGLNGVSVEFAPGPKPVFKRDFVLHRSARMFGLAGSVNPAYDGARLSLRDMEDTVADTELAAVAAADIADPAPARTADEGKAERDAVAAVVKTADSGFRITRAEAMYGRDATNERGEWRSFLRDLEDAHNGSPEANERLFRHQTMLTDIARQMERAGDVLSSEIPGAYPNEYLPGLLTPRILKGRPMGGFYDRFSISSALPQIFAKVTTSTTAAAQGAEGANPAASDLATTAVTVNPLLYGASTAVSRQVVDGASPAAETMILQDMYEAYSQVSEGAIKTAVEAGSTASGVAITAATPWAGTLANVINYYVVRFREAQGAFIPPALYPVLLAQGDTTGRPFIPMIGAMNSDGQVTPGGTQSNILGALTQLSWQSTVNVCVFARTNDFVIFESPIATFRYEQATGPSAFNIGCWAYLGIGARLGSLKVTAA